MEGSGRYREDSRPSATAPPWPASAPRVFGPPRAARRAFPFLFGVVLGLVAVPHPNANAEPVTFYFSTSGSDANDGRSESRPKRSIALVPGLVDGGNRALLRRGDVWHEYQVPWDFSDRSGTANSPMVVGAYGDPGQPRPVVAELVRNPRSGWRNEPGPVYSVAQYGGAVADRVIRLFLDRRPIPKVPNRSSLVDDTYCVAGGRIYVRSNSFPADYIESIQAAADPYFVLGHHTRHLLIENLDLRGGNHWAVGLFLAPNDDITFRNVAVSQYRANGFSFTTTGDPYTGPNSSIRILDCTIDKSWTPGMNHEYRHPVVTPSGADTIWNGANGAEPGGMGILFDNAVVDAVVRGCLVTNQGHTGIGTVYNDATLVSAVRNIVVEKNTVTAGASSYCRAIGVSRSSNVVIRQNYFYDNNIQSQLAGDSVYVYSNIFDATLPSPVRRVATCLSTYALYSPQAIPHVVRNHVYANNTLFNAETFLSMRGYVPNDGFLAADNTFSNNLCAEWRLYPSTRGDRSTASYAESTYAGTWTFRNNGFWESTGHDIALMVDRYGGLDEYTMSMLNARPGCSGNRRADPRFIGGRRAPEYFRLAADSPYLCGGVPLESLLPPGMPAVDFFGNPFASSPSRGALQYVGEVPPANQDCITPSSPSEFGGDGGLPVRPPREERGPARAPAIASARPNPTTDGGIDVSFTLADDSPARLEVLDVAGRVMETHDLTALGQGQHQIRLGTRRSLPPGHYRVRILQGGRSAARVVIVIR